MTQSDEDQPPTLNRWKFAFSVIAAALAGYVVYGGLGVGVLLASDRFLCSGPNGGPFSECPPKPDWVDPVMWFVAIIAVIAAVLAWKVLRRWRNL